jgi:hypothetical protein
VTTYSLDELLGTKLRALYQRAKGRDLFDLWAALKSGKADPRRMVEAFRYCTNAPGKPGPSGKELLGNLTLKMEDAGFIGDMASPDAPDAERPLI